jgi:Tfp pilus assembly protein PilX
MKTKPHAARRERGAILFIALIVLVAMSLTGIAIIRSVDTSVTVAGNLAFRQVAILAADRGLESARAWLSSTAASSLYNDSPGGYSYFATMQTNLDLTGTDPLKTDFNWSTATVISPDPDANLNSVRVVIHRMCDTVGNPASANCIRSAAGSGSGTPAGELAYGTLAITSVAQVLYRITAKVTGPRNTVSYVQQQAQENLMANRPGDFRCVLRRLFELERQHRYRKRAADRRRYRCQTQHHVHPGRLGQYGLGLHAGPCQR